MKSKIYAEEQTENKERKFGSANSYYPCYLITIDGYSQPCLFTDAEIAKAMERGNKNPEDIDDYDSWLEMFD